MERYLKRVMDEILAFRLRSAGGVLLTGPKWCGKSTTASQQARSRILFRAGPRQEQNIARALAMPDEALKGDTPRLLDEWQLVPTIWDEVRTEIDERGRTGQFILTGSSVPPDVNLLGHSGTGRISRLVMRPMSLWESLESTGEVSVAALFRAPAQISGTAKMKLPDYAFALARGGWPFAVTMPRREALQQAIDYYEGLVASDMTRVDGVTRREDRCRAFFRSYARLVATQADMAAVRADMSGHEGVTLTAETIASYASAARRLFVVEELDAWNPVLLQKDTIRKTPTRHLTDPSLACAALGIGPDDLLDDLHAMGYLFENMAIRDLRVYAEANDGGLAHFRDRYGLECDAVLRLRNGAFGLIEVKLFSQAGIDEGARNLARLAAKIDTTKMRPPSFLAVVTGTEFAYRRPDGVYVIPLACLRP